MNMSILKEHQKIIEEAFGEPLIRENNPLLSDKANSQIHGDSPMQDELKQSIDDMKTDKKTLDIAKVLKKKGFKPKA